MSDALILSTEGARVPPSHFTRLLAAFDPNLRCVWGLGQARPFPGWVIERRIPDHMKAKVYSKRVRAANEERYGFQIVTDSHGQLVTRRMFDMMPDWHPIYCVIGEDGKPIRELGERVIDYLRQHYERTLLGFPELSMRHWREDHQLQAERDEQKADQLLDRAARKVMERKTEIFPDSFAFGGFPRDVKEGTDIYGSEDRSDIGCDQGPTEENTEPPRVN